LAKRPISWKVNIRTFLYKKWSIISTSLETRDRLRLDVTGS